MVQVGSKFGATRQPVSQAGRRKVVVTKREKRKRVTRTKKNEQKPKRSADKKKGFFCFWDKTGFDLLASP